MTFKASGRWFAWLSLHPWEHFLFTGDRGFLEKRGWPLMKGAARFLLDFLIEAPPGTPIAGKLTTSPSHSPENAFLTPDGQRSSFTYGATMDIMLIRQVLGNCIAATKILDSDADFRAECQAALAKLQPIVISRPPAASRNGSRITVKPTRATATFPTSSGSFGHADFPRTPELLTAARKVLETRGDGGTGWSLAWKVSFWPACATATEPSTVAEPARPVTRQMSATRVQAVPTRTSSAPARHSRSTRTSVPRPALPKC